MTPIRKDWDIRGIYSKKFDEKVMKEFDKRTPSRLPRLDVEKVPNFDKPVLKFFNKVAREVLRTTGKGQVIDFTQYLDEFRQIGGEYARHQVQPEPTETDNDSQLVRDNTVRGDTKGVHDSHV